MGRRKIGKEQIRKIQRSKGTYYITIPIRIVRALGWRERQKVVVEHAGKDALSIKDWKK